jgi:hypothetical protein
MNPAKWLRTKIFSSVDPEKVQRVEELSEEVSREARRLRRRVAHPEVSQRLREAALRESYGK